MGDLNPASLNLQWKNEKKKQNKTKPNQPKPKDLNQVY